MILIASCAATPPMKADSVCNSAAPYRHLQIINEPSCDKTNKMTCAHIGTDQPGHLPSLIRVLNCLLHTLWVAYDPKLLPAGSEDSHQTGWLPRLIPVFTGCTGHFIGFIKQRLKL